MTIKNHLPAIWFFLQMLLLRDVINVKDALPIQPPELKITIGFVNFAIVMGFIHGLLRSSIMIIKVPSI